MLPKNRAEDEFAMYFQLCIKLTQDDIKFLHRFSMMKQSSIYETFFYYRKTANQIRYQPGFPV